MRMFIAKLLVVAASAGVIGIAPITAAEAYKVKHHHHHKKHHHKKHHHKKHHKKKHHKH